jgi:predicted dehydrogenase
MSTAIGWGILGLGGIAKNFATAMRRLDSGELLAVGSPDATKAQRFATTYGAERACDSYEAVLADPQVQAVYIALPNHLHESWAIQAAQAGKHLLVEKPLATNASAAERIVQAAQDAGVLLMESQPYRCHPQTQRVLELIASESIGQLRLIQTQCSVNHGGSPNSSRFRWDTAGGAIMDGGAYGLSLVRRLVAASRGVVARSALGLDSAPAKPRKRRKGAAESAESAESAECPNPEVEPLSLQAVGWINPDSGVDEQAVAALSFADRLDATVVCGHRAHVESTTRLWGSEGHLILPNPWYPQPEGEVILLCRGGEETRIPVEAPSGLYTLLIDEFCRCLTRGLKQSPAVPWWDSLGNMRALDEWRRQVGVTFEQDQEAGEPNSSAAANG